MVARQADDAGRRPPPSCCADGQSTAAWPPPQRGHCHFTTTGPIVPRTLACFLARIFVLTVNVGAISAQDIQVEQYSI